MSNFVSQSNNRNNKNKTNVNNNSSKSGKSNFTNNERLSNLEERISKLESQNNLFRSKIEKIEDKIEKISNGELNKIINSRKELTQNEINEYFRIYSSNSPLTTLPSVNSISSQFCDNILKYTRNFSNEIDSIINFLEPKESSINNRAKITSFLKYFITRTITCCTFQIDKSILFCNLPDDPIKVSVILSNSSSYLSSLYNILHDRFIKYSNQEIYFQLNSDINDDTNDTTTNCDANSISPYTSTTNNSTSQSILSTASLSVNSVDLSTSSDPNLNFQDFTNSKSYFKVLLSNTKMENVVNSTKISGIINNIPFEISFNSRVDLCFLAFIEKVSILVGKDNLFKRSLMLLNAWWSYENIFYDPNSQSPQTNPIKDIIPDFALTFMLISIFNCHSYKISSPLDAFLIFINIYSKFDAKTHAITLQGIKPFKANSNEIMYWNSNSANDNFLIPFSLYEEFFNIINLNGFEKLINEDNYNYRNMKDIKDCYICVERTEFSIIHPFTFDSMTNENLSIKKVEKIQNYFDQTNNKLLEFFNIVKNKVDGNFNQVHSFNHSSSQPLFNNAFVSTFFPLTLQRYHDINNPSFSSISLTSHLSSHHFQQRNGYFYDHHGTGVLVYNVNLGELWSNIFCCNFILESVLTESALITICTQLLNDKKFLSVGELGKLLQDITSINNLSSQLREKYGGLKKLIEKYSDIFIATKDHHFNPNISLKKLLSDKQINLLESGELQLQSIFKHNNNRIHVEKNKQQIQQPQLQSQQQVQQQFSQVSQVSHTNISLNNPYQNQNQQGYNFQSQFNNPSLLSSNFYMPSQQVLNNQPTQNHNINHNSTNNSYFTGSSNTSGSSNLINFQYRNNANTLSQNNYKSF